MLIGQTFDSFPLLEHKCSVRLISYYTNMATPVKPCMLMGSPHKSDCRREKWPHTKKLVSTITFKISESQIYIIVKSLLEFLLARMIYLEILCHLKITLVKNCSSSFLLKLAFSFNLFLSVYDSYTLPHCLQVIIDSFTCCQSPNSINVSIIIF